MTTKQASALLSSALMIMIHSFDMRAQQLPLPPNALAGELSGGVSMSLGQPSNFAPNAPRVTCQGNRLTITAENSTLSSILSAVHTCIGIAIDAPDATGGELSYVQLGPGPIREVLDSLLSSTQYNYAIQSSSSEPEKVTNILIMMRVKTGDDSQVTGIPGTPEFTMTPARQTWLASVRALKAGAQTDGDRSRIVGAGPVTFSSPDDVRRLQAVPDSSTADASATSSTQTSKETTTAKLAVTDGQQAAVASEAASAAAAPTPASELQNRIGEMQQLFEQRKKMMADLGVAPAQN